VFVFALILSSLLTWGLGWRHPGGSDAVGASLMFLFLVLLFAMLAGGIWIRPWGPVVWGSPWLALLLIGLFVSLLVLAIAAPGPRPPRTPTEAAVQRQGATAAATAFGVFFWVLVLGLLIAVVGGYLV
jgi:hypothetical protein